MLEVFSREETAKVLMLVDMVRCPREYRQGGQTPYYDHLRKGIYNICYSIPIQITFGTLIEHIKTEAQSKYLEGEEGYYFLAPNTIKTQREQVIYVDVTNSNEDLEWHDPSKFDYLDQVRLGRNIPSPQALRLVQAFDNLGLFSEGSLKVIAEFWHPIIDKIEESNDWKWLEANNSACLHALRRANCLLRDDAEDIRTITKCWQFPSYHVLPHIAHGGVA